MNLQLFALILKDDGGGKKKEEKKTATFIGYDPNSVVDTFKSLGMDSSFNARKDYAENVLGISNYTGAPVQNTKMLDMLKNGTTPAKNAPKVTDNPKAEPKAEPKPVVDNTGAPAVTAPATINGVDADTMQALNTPYVESSAVQEAWNVTNAMKEKLVSGRTSYTDQIQSLMNQIRNRDKFSYDVDTDMLFQQALASAMGSGQQAMKDTIGQASALTGGYASSYATSAGNQAYNAYIQDAYNNLPEYYQMALEAYNMEGQDMYNQLAMLNDADATEYGRMYDAWNTSHTEWQDLYNQDYSAWRDNWNNNYNMATLGNSDYWNNKSMINSNEQNALDRIHDSFEAGLDRAHDSKEASLDREHDNAWNEKEYNAKYDLNGDGVVNEADSALEEETEEWKTPSDDMYDQSVEAYKIGGEAGLTSFLEKYPDYDVETLYDYAVKNGMPMEQRRYTKVETTANLFGADRNGRVRDEISGIEYDIKDLPKSIRMILTDLEEGETWDFSTNSKVTSGKGGGSR